MTPRAARRRSPAFAATQSSFGPFHRCEFGVNRNHRGRPPSRRDTPRESRRAGPSVSRRRVRVQPRSSCEGRGARPGDRSRTVRGSGLPFDERDTRDLDQSGADLGPHRVDPCVQALRKHVGERWIQQLEDWGREAFARGVLTGSEAVIRMQILANLSSDVCSLTVI